MMADERLAQILDRRRADADRRAQEAAEARARAAEELERRHQAGARCQPYLQLIDRVVGEINSEISDNDLLLRASGSIDVTQPKYVGSASVRYAAKKDRETDGWCLGFDFKPDGQTVITLGSMFQSASRNEVKTVADLNEEIIRESIVDYLDATVPG